MSEAPAVVLLSADLMMTSSVGGAAAQHGLPFRTLSGSAQLADCRDNDLILIDLATPGLSIADAGAALSDHQKRTAVTYGPHVHVDRFQQAEAAGFLNRLARGAFTADVGRLVGQYAEQLPND